jgi:hypothetical protein
MPLLGAAVSAAPVSSDGTVRLLKVPVGGLPQQALDRGKAFIL